MSEALEKKLLFRTDTKVVLTQEEIDEARENYAATRNPLCPRCGGTSVELKGPYKGADGTHRNELYCPRCHASVPLW